MNSLIMFVTLLAVAFAQYGGFEDQVRKEVQSIIGSVHGHHTITVSDCISKCDAAFDMANAQDEIHTDDACRHFCSCEINQTCNVQPTDPAHGHHG